MVDIGDGKMKITNEKMRDELTSLYTDYAREREEL